MNNFNVRLKCYVHIYAFGKQDNVKLDFDQFWWLKRQNNPPPGCILSLKYSTVFRHTDQHWNTSLCMIWNIVEHRAAGTRSVMHGNACFFFICLWTLKLAVNHKNKSAIMSFANSFKMETSCCLEQSKTNKQLFTYIYRSCTQAYIHNKKWCLCLQNKNNPKMI